MSREGGKRTKRILLSCKKGGSRAKETLNRCSSFLKETQKFVTSYVSKSKSSPILTPTTEYLEAGFMIPSD